MKRNFFLFLVLLSLIILLVRFSSENFMDMLGKEQKAGIKVTSLPSGAKVLLDGLEVGQTPYQNESLEPGEHNLQLVATSGAWLNRVNLNGGTLTVVNRELGGGEASSSGEVLTLVKGSGVVITSQPSGADVQIDGKLSGQTPLSVASLIPGEHIFLLSHDNYLKRSIRALIPNKMTLNIDVDLAMSELTLAQTAAKIAPTTVVSAKLVVGPTPNGFLRVRDQPSTSGKEIARAKTGDSLVMLAEDQGWYKVRLADGTEGYVSADYVQKSS
ncbi:PEGA domain-containing protein [Patescibacteria group bacterium]|nr:PEGA domain-containing protein [Patescibacteria group bacterium]